MEIMNTSKIENAVHALYVKAAMVKPVIVKHGEDVYSILWNSYHGQFEVTKNGEYFARYNTRKVSQARAWLKEAL